MGEWRPSRTAATSVRRIIRRLRRRESQERVSHDGERWNVLREVELRECLSAIEPCCSRRTASSMSYPLRPFCWGRGTLAAQAPLYRKVWTTE